MKCESPQQYGLSLWLIVPPQFTKEGSEFLSPLPEEANQELGIPRGKIELEDGLLDERLSKPLGIFLQMLGNPFDGTAQVFAIREEIMHGFAPWSGFATTGLKMNQRGLVTSATRVTAAVPSMQQQIPGKKNPGGEARGSRRSYLFHSGNQPALEEAWWLQKRYSRKTFVAAGEKRPSAALPLSLVNDVPFRYALFLRISGALHLDIFDQP